MVNHISLFSDLGKENEVKMMFDLLRTLKDQVDDKVGDGT